MDLSKVSSEELRRELNRRGALEYAKLLASYGDFDPEKVMDDKSEASAAKSHAEEVLRTRLREIEDQKEPLDGAAYKIKEELEQIKEAREVLYAWDAHGWEF